MRSETETTDPTPDEPTFIPPAQLEGKREYWVAASVTPGECGADISEVPPWVHCPHVCGDLLTIARVHLECVQIPAHLEGHIEQSERGNIEPLTGRASQELDSQIPLGEHSFPVGDETAIDHGTPSLEAHGTTHTV
jgi:hypothetical protein